MTTPKQKRAIRQNLADKEREVQSIQARLNGAVNDVGKKYWQSKLDEAQSSLDSARRAYTGHNT